MAVYRIWLDEERVRDGGQLLLYHSVGTKDNLLAALIERKPTAGLGGPIMDMYVAMAIPPLTQEDVQYVEQKIGLPLNFLEVRS